MKVQKYSVDDEREKDQDKIFLLLYWEQFCHDQPPQELCLEWRRFSHTLPRRELAYLLQEIDWEVKCPASVQNKEALYWIAQRQEYLSSRTALFLLNKSNSSLFDAIYYGD